MTTRIILFLSLMLFWTAALADAPRIAERPEIRFVARAEVPKGRDGPARAERPPSRLSVLPVPGSDGLAAVIASAGLSGTHSIALIDVANGTILEAYNADLALPPASVTKLITARYGIETLGREYRFQTRVMADGVISGGVLNGDLILVGGGDPALDSDELADLAAQVRAAGIRQVSGRFLYDETALPPLSEIQPGQPDHVAYNPGIGGLNLNFNRVYLEWGPGGDDLRLEARAEQFSPRVSLISVRADGREGDIFQYSNSERETWSVAADALRRKGGRWLPVRRPGAYAAHVFRSVARIKGVVLPRPERGAAKGREVARHVRRPLPLVSRGMLHFSTNLTAEIIGLTAGRARGVRAADLPASAVQMQQWARTEGISTGVFLDHSGLNPATRLPAGEMARYLAKSDRSGAYDGLIRRYYVADSGGKRPAVEGVDVRAKTGTLNFVRGLSGYITARNGKRFAFAIFTADLAARARIDNGKEMPPGVRRFAKRAVELEKAVLRRWVKAYGR